LENFSRVGRGEEEGGVRIGEGRERGEDCVIRGENLRDKL